MIRRQELFGWSEREKEEEEVTIEGYIRRKTKREKMQTTQTASIITNRISNTPTTTSRVIK